MPSTLDVCCSQIRRYTKTEAPSVRFIVNLCSAIWQILREAASRGLSAFADILVLSYICFCFSYLIIIFVFFAKCGRLS